MELGHGFILGLGSHWFASNCRLSKKPDKETQRGDCTSRIEHPPGDRRGLQQEAPYAALDLQNKGGSKDRRDRQFPPIAIPRDPVRNERPQSLPDQAQAN